MVLGHERWALGRKSPEDSQPGTRYPQLEAIPESSAEPMNPLPDHALLDGPTVHLEPGAERALTFGTASR